MNRNRLRKPMKKFLKLTVMACCALGFSHIAEASAPMSTIANPGFYRIHIGKFEVTSISDGTVDLPISKLLAHIPPKDLSQALVKDFLTDPTETSDNSYLINTGSKLILIDTGAGKLFGPTLGKMLVNLKASGYQPEQVDMVLITHMHPDHVGGLMTEDKMTFPNATIYADQADADFWLSADNLAKAPDANKGFFQGAMASLNPYVKAGKTKWFNGESEIVPGLKTRASHGHTAGHTTYLVESEGKKLVIMGDLMHLAAVQFEKPSVTIQFDTDQKMAEANRKLAFAEAAKEGYLIAATHLSFPGLGHIRTDKKTFAYVPMNYAR